MLALSLALIFGVASAYPNPDPDPVSKTTSQHNILVPTITTTGGDVKGSVTISRLGKTIYSYKGLRFAKPPLKDLRFQVVYK